MGKQIKMTSKLVFKLTLRTFPRLVFRAVIFICLSPFPAGPEELARQNKITQQILEAYIQKKLGLASGNVRAPSIFDILPMKKTEERTIRESVKEMQIQEPEEPMDEMQDIPEMEDPPDVQEYGEDDSLQSVESEQIDSIYSEGTKTVFFSPFLSLF